MDKFYLTKCIIIILIICILTTNNLFEVYKIAKYRKS